MAYFSSLPFFPRTGRAAYIAYMPYRRSQPVDFPQRFIAVSFFREHHQPLAVDNTTLPLAERIPYPGGVQPLAVVAFVTGAEGVLEVIPVVSCRLRADVLRGFVDIVSDVRQRHRDRAVA